MRQLRLVFAHTDKMTKVLVAATILPLTGGCGGQSDNSSTQIEATGGGLGTTGGNSTVGGSSWVIGPDAGGSTSIGGNPATGGTGGCPSYYTQTTYVVTLPSGDTPKDAAAQCNWTGAFASDRPAAKVSLKYDPTVPAQATGTVTIDPDVLNAISDGYISVSSVTASGATVSNLVRVNDAYTFNVKFVDNPYLGTSYTFSVTLSYTCSPIMSSTRTVYAATTVTLCGGYNGSNWVSTGDTCTICYPMAEMAAQLMPAPANEPDDIPLPGEIDVRIVEVAREGRTLVLLAKKPRESDGLSLTWQASAGHLTHAADDVVVWTLPEAPGPHLVQVAAECGRSASVVSYLHRDEA